MLAVKETMESLKHWKVTFKTYYRRDSFFKIFLTTVNAWNVKMIACDDEEDDSNNAHVQRIKKGNFTKKFNECGYKGYHKRPQLILNQANAYIVNT